MMTVEEPPILEGSPPDDKDISSCLTAMVKRLRPSVVQVRSAGRGGGAGVIWRANGGLVTNNHVVGDRRSAVDVLLADGRSFSAAVVSRDPTLDLAWLEIQAGDLPAAPVGDSTRLRVGELVFAIGHPWGQRGVVTAGIVSGIGAVAVGDGSRSVPYVRSDVRLAPGNSGGPLINAAGDVVGINAMIFGGDLSVAIPSQVIGDWLTGLAEHRVTLGVQVQPVALPVEVRRRLRPDRETGLLVVAVERDAPADRAGILVGDVLLNLADTLTQDVVALRSVLSRWDTARPLPLLLLRANDLSNVRVNVQTTERAA